MLFRRFLVLKQCVISYFRSLVAYHLGFTKEYFCPWKECADEAFAGQSLGNLLRLFNAPGSNK